MKEAPCLKKKSHKLPNVSQRIPHSKRRILQSVKPNEHPENVRLFCQVAVITRWQYYWGGQKAGFHWTDLKPILHTHLELGIALSILEKLKKNLSTLLWPSSLGSWGFMILGLKVINGFSISRVFVMSNKPGKAELSENLRKPSALNQWNPAYDCYEKTKIFYLPSREQKLGAGVTRYYYSIVLCWINSFLF